MFKNQNFSLIQIGNIKNVEGLFYYLWIFLFMPILCTFLFTIPIYKAFRFNRKLNRVLMLGLVLIVEYFVYTYSASTTDLLNGLINGAIGIFVFLVFFYLHLRKNIEAD